MQRIHTSDDEVRAMRAYLDDLIEDKNKKCIFYKARLKTLLFGLVLLMLLSLMFNVFSARSRGGTPTILGYQFYSIESGSMEPVYEIGNVIMAKKYNGTDDLDVGTVITFTTAKGMVVTHRIVEVIQDESGHSLYRTKGDNPDNIVDPDLVSKGQIRAVTIMKLPFF